MYLYASDVCANSPDKERYPEQREEPLFSEWHEGQHKRARIRGYMDPLEIHSYLSAHSLRRSEIPLERMRRPP